MKRINSIHYMRGLVTLLVMLAHVNLLVDETLFHGIFVQGWCGVDYFFVLSGFLIIYTFKKSVSVKDYLIKRFVRICPVYWLYTILFAVVGSLIYEVMNRKLISWISMDIKGIMISMLFCPTDVGGAIANYTHSMDFVV